MYFLLVMTRSAKTLLALAVLGLAVVLAACGDAGGGSGGDSSKLSLVAYSTPKEAYEEIIPAFAKTPAGAGTTFTPSYGNSGDQAGSTDATRSFNRATSPVT